MQWVARTAAASPVTTTTKAAAAALRRSPAAAAVLAIRSASSSSSHGDHDHHDGPSMHKEDWLKLAREWPEEHYHPPHSVQRIPSHVHWPSEHPDGSETHEQHETFFNASTARFLLFVATIAGLYKLNDYLFKDEPLHPATRLINFLARTAEENDRINEARIRHEQTRADDRLILMNAPRQGDIHRYSFPDVFQRCSDHLIEPGSQIDVSDVKVKHSWQEWDDVKL